MTRHAYQKNFFATQVDETFHCAPDCKINDARGKWEKCNIHVGNVN